jgi:hypothetical protein
MVMLSDCFAKARWLELMKPGDLSVWVSPTGDWRCVGEVKQNSRNPKQLEAKNGRVAILNGDLGKTANLFTKQEFGDIEAHIEFIIPAKSNSGIYFMGRYEIQVYDSFGVEKDQYPGIECGGIYPRWIANKNVEGRSPRVNASMPPGQWQTFDVIFRAPKFNEKGEKIKNAVFVKIVHNGQIVHENVVLHGPTRSAAFDDEKPAGPIMLQGDHGPVAYRNLKIRPLLPESK